MISARARWPPSADTDSAAPEIVRPTTAIAIPGSLPENRNRRDGTSHKHASAKAAATRQICRAASVVAVAAAEIGPLRSIGRPHPAPATVVVGVEIGRAEEREAVMEATPAMEPEPRKPRPESAMREGRTHETSAAEMRPDTHRGEMRSAHRGEMRAAPSRRHACRRPSLRRACPPPPPAIPPPMPPACPPPPMPPPCPPARRRHHHRRRRRVRMPVTQAQAPWPAHPR